MILLWGIAGDEPLALVRSTIERRGSPHYFLDQQATLQTEMEFVVAREVHGSVRVCGQTIALESITALYLRPYDSRRIRAVAQAGRDSPEWHHALNLEDALVSWAEMTPALVINRPTAMASNNSKPYQVALIRATGMNTPDTLVTTDPQAALEFWSKHGTVIYKSVSGVRSIVSRLKAEHLDRLNTIGNCPTQFQQYIDGNDWRVHVVGDEIFACEVISPVDDYRYAGRQGGTVEIHARELQQDIADKCRALARTLQLAVAGIDLRHTLEGDWYCFEVNPSPGFSFYQHATGQPISDAIARLLERAS
jgi:glutathione synthase/RimK-type ligase-like ATP-grasp enzyme